MPENRDADGKRAPSGKRYSPSIENGGDIPDNTYRDGHNAERAVAMLRHLKQSGSPFFLAVGFSRPHLPFAAPAKYWNLYNRDAIEIPSTQDVIGSVPYARSSWGELRNYSDIPAKADPLDEAKARELIHGYYASTSYVDAQIGRVLTAIDDLQLSDNTIVVLWGDHGWYLGDYGDWCKHSNYEVATRVPLIISVPQKLGGSRGHSSALAELVDLYPTLCELSGTEIPAHCQGHSLVPVLQSPNRLWKEAAFSQYRKNKPKAGSMLGTSVRTDRFRYTEWRNVKTGKLDAVELIDFSNDPGATINVADRAQYANYLPHLEKLASRSGRGVLPPQ